MNRFLVCRATSLVLLVGAFFASGCATIVKGTSQGVTVKTDPPGAICEFSKQGKSVGVVNPTPGTAQLGKGASALDVICKKTGFLDANAKLSSSFQGWTLGNAILGGVVGIVVDAGSGAMHEYQSELSMKLLPESFRSEESRDAYFTAWRAEVLAQSESTKTEITGKCSKDQCEKLLKKADEKTEEALTEIESSRMRATIAPIASDKSAPLPPVTRTETSAAAPVVSVAPAPSATEADRSLMVGDRWTYKLSDQRRAIGSVSVEIVGINGQNVRERFTREGHSGFAAEHDTDASFRPARFQTINFPGGYDLPEFAPYLLLDSTLKRGQSWDGLPGVFFMHQVGKVTLVSHLQVVGQETVRVPAGTFRAWKIETDSPEVPAGGINVKAKCTFWYSPEVKRTVKMSIDSITSMQAYASDMEIYELVSFRPGK